MKVIGIALSDEYTDISLYKEEYTYRFPTLLSREKKEDLFYIGEDAYKKNLDGNVFLVDKLLSLFRKKGSATFSERCYEAGELLGIFLESLLLEEKEEELLPLMEEYQEKELSLSKVLHD